MMNIENNLPEVAVNDLRFVKGEGYQKRHFIVPGLPSIDIDIQTISNETLGEIFKSRKNQLNNIPKKSDVILEEDQSEYYKGVKKSVLEQLQAKKFAIIQGPTGTGKTTLAKTIAYELGLEFYEVGASSEKIVEDYTTDIETNTKNNIIQIKTISGPLEKAIKKGGIFLVNEANALNPEISLAMANMIESGFIVVGNKKIKVHDNFKLIFTSNEGYAGTNDYNSAVLRKAGGAIHLGYEPEIDGELKVVKNIYTSIRSKSDTDFTISDLELRKITETVRNIRESITKSNIESETQFLSQEGSNFGDFFYIRLYEKLIINLVNSENGNLLEEVRNIVIPLLQEKIVGISGEEYISHENSKDSLNEILSTHSENKIIDIEKGGKTVLNQDFGKILENFGVDERLLEKSGLTTNGESGNMKFKQSLNTGFLRNTLKNEQKSIGEELKRDQDLQDLAENINEIILDTRIDKIVSHLKIINNNNKDYLEVTINNRIIYFGLKKGKEMDLSKITINNFKEKVFGNTDFNIFLEEESGDFSIHENYFSNSKVLEIRKFSKIISREIDGENIITLLGFKAESRDIRYKGQETGKYYIPQSKVNDILLSNYRVVDNASEYFTKKKDNQHILVLNNNSELEFIKKSDYKSGKILEKVKQQDLNNKIREETFGIFGNIDKHKFTNGGIEKSQTGTPINIEGEQYPVSSKVEQLLESTPTFGDSPSESTQKVIDEIIDAFNTNQDILLTGYSGVGKSTYPIDVARRMDLPYISFSITPDTNEDVISGSKTFNEGLLEDTKSPFLDYYINGGIVELKELNASSDMTFLHNFMDTNGTIVFNGKEYRRHQNFHIIATLNPFDNRIFEGVGPINLATQARFKSIEVDYIQDVNEETEILLKTIQINNQELIDSFDSEDDFKNYIKDSLEKIVFPIRKYFKELIKTQEDGNDENLKLISKKVITIDIYTKWLKNSKNKDDIIQNFRTFFTFPEGTQIPEILQNIINIIK